MKKLIATAICLLMVMTPLAAAQEISSELPNVVIIPGNLFYGFKRFGENIKLYFIFDDAKKAEYRYRLAELRLAEANKLSDGGKDDLAEQILSEYQNELNLTDEDIKKAIALGKNITALIDLINDKNYYHIIVLKKVHKNPFKARLAIERSLEYKAKILKHTKDREMVNMTVIVNNQTVSVTVPEKFAEKFIEKAEKYEEKENVRAEVKKEVAQEEIDYAKEKISELQDLNLTGPSKVLYENAQKHLENAEIAFNESKYGKAFGQAIAAQRLVRNVKK